jgi:hypothetical protein
VQLGTLCGLGKMGKLGTLCGLGKLGVWAKALVNMQQW